jgi:diadenosine hexaphosphate hydrolase (ATP-forming)
MPKPNKPNNRFEQIKKYFPKPKASIQEIVREPTSGGIVFRHTSDGEIEILLIQDAKDRWTIPKGHIEEGETASQTARREIGEEAGLHDVDMLGWLGKIHFRYRRIDRLVLMTTQIYLVRVRTDGNEIQKEEWMNGIKWFPFNEALDLIEYEDIAKLMLKAKTRIREEKL